MVRITPFHERLRELNATGLYVHWAGYLSALRYDASAVHEYFAIRAGAGFFDSSPLYKHRVHGPDAERFLAGVMTRDVRACRPGRAQYVAWCDDDGFVLEDGVLFRHDTDEFLMTCGEPALGYLRDLAGRLRVEIEDASEEYAVLAVQGPRSREVLVQVAPEVAGLAYFGLVPAKIGTTAVTVSRTGYTGDLGYELMVPADGALEVLDTVVAAGAPYGLRPFGEEALLMARIEAGLLLRGVEFTSARYAFNDSQRLTPQELGLGWMLRGVDTTDRRFIGRDAIRRELRDGTSRWATVGLLLDWADYDRLYDAAGLIPPKDPTPSTAEAMVYAAEGGVVGYTTSSMYSPVLQRHIALARVRPAYAAPGATVRVELTVDHEHQTVAARIAALPLFDPARRTVSA